MWNEFKKTFCRTPLLKLAEDDLYDAQRKLMAAHALKEHADAELAGHQQRVARLKQLVAELQAENASKG